MCGIEVGKSFYFFKNDGFDGCQIIGIIDIVGNEDLIGKFEEKLYGK